METHLAKWRQWLTLSNFVIFIILIKLVETGKRILTLV